MLYPNKDEKTIHVGKWVPKNGETVHEKMKESTQTATQAHVLQPEYSKEGMCL